MTPDWLKQNWALFAGLALLVPVCSAVLRALLARSARGQLRGELRQLRKVRRNQAGVQRRRSRLEARARALQGRAERVPPRVVQQARDALSDADALCKIAGDQVLVAENRVRKIIHTEFAPDRQAGLRSKYLPGDAPDARPFSFE